MGDWLGQRALRPVLGAPLPQARGLMAAAGPAGNFLIAIAAFLVLRIGLGLGVFVAPARVNFETIVAGAGGEASFPTMLLSVLLIQNVLLGVFNLLPLPPLDGAAVFAAIVLRAARRQRVRHQPHGLDHGVAGGLAGVPCHHGPALLDAALAGSPDASYRQRP